MSSEHVEVLRELRDTGDVSDWRAMESALDAAIASLSAPQPPAEAQRCTCPSGDGSLRWPCPAHPPEAQGDGEASEGWHAALDSASELVSNAPDARYRKRAEQVRDWIKAHPAEAQPVAPTDGSPFDMAMREYEAAAIKCGAGRNNAQAVDAAADRVFALYNAKPPSAPVGVEAAARKLLEAYDDNAHPFEAARVAEELRNALAQQPAAVDGAMVERALNARYNGYDVACFIDEKADGRGVIRAALTAALAGQQGGAK